MSTCLLAVALRARRRESAGRLFSKKERPVSRKDMCEPLFSAKKLEPSADNALHPRERFRVKLMRGYFIRTGREPRLDSPPPCEADLRIDVDDRNACFYRGNKILINNSRTAMENQGDLHGFFYRRDARDIEPRVYRLESAAACALADKHSVQIPDRRRKEIYSRFLYERRGFVGRSQVFGLYHSPFGNVFQYFRRRADVSQFSLNKNVRVYLFCERYHLFR